MFRDLNGVGGRTLAQIVRNNPQVEPLFLTEVASDPPHEDFVLSVRIHRHGVHVGHGVILNDQAGHELQGLFDIGHAEGAFQFQVNTLGMPANDRNPNGCRADLNSRVVQDFLGLVMELHLFLGEVILQKDIAMGEAIPVDGVRINARGVCTRSLLLELVDARLPRSGYALLGADDGTANEEAVMERLECHDQLYGGAIGIGDDQMVAYRVRIDLRYDQGYLWIHTPS